jgi:hypothetical protein
VSVAAEAALWGLALGGTLFAGAVVAARVQLPARFSAFVTAFGGGILLAAIALELVPIIAAGRSRAFTVSLLGAIGVSLVGATILGATVLSDASDSLIGSAEALASGAVHAVVAISIVPYAFEEVSRWVAVATAAGFVAGYLLS